MKRVYLDHNATTPIHPEVSKAMLPYYEEIFGNPSSIHQFGQQARNAIDEAGEKVAEFIGAKPEVLPEIVTRLRAMSPLYKEKDV
jgi:cysteine desulfurase